MRELHGNSICVRQRSGIPERDHSERRCLTSAKHEFSTAA